MSSLTLLWYFMLVLAMLLQRYFIMQIVGYVSTDTVTVFYLNISAEKLSRFMT